MDMIRTWVESHTEREATSYGAILRSKRYPLVHEANLAWVESMPAEGPQAIVSDLDRTFRGTAVKHRSILFRDAEEAYAAQEALLAAGFQGRAELIMAKLGLPACITNPDVGIREVGTEASEDDYRAVRAALHASFGYAEEESRQVHALERERAAAVGEKAYVSFLGGRPAGTFTLWPRRPFAMIGNVGTLPEFRMRGVGRTMIFEASRLAIDARCEWVVLTADRFDFPATMYETLGFQPVGEFRSFLKR